MSNSFTCKAKTKLLRVSYTDHTMLQNDSRVWVRGSFLIGQWHDPGKPSHGSLQHGNSLCTAARSFLPGSHTVHHTAHIYA